MSNKLTELQQKVFDLLDTKPNTDVALADLYNAVYGGGQSDLFPPTNRDMQQKMGPLFARINTKLKRGRIEPGIIKQTYRLNTKKKD
jgi:hypothetical protein